MKTTFSKTWKSSKKTRKQRKYRYKAPLHIKRKFLTINLAKELREKHGFRNVKARKGDTVRIQRGKYKGQEGKIDYVFPKKGIVYIEGFEKPKGEGSKVREPFQPSNLQIVKLDLSDKIRKKKLTKKEGEQ